MNQVTLTFDKILPTTRFQLPGDPHIYTKTLLHNRARYGWVNAVGPAFYEGDSGHRHFYDDQVIILCDRQPSDPLPPQCPTDEDCPQCPDWDDCPFGPTKCSNPYALR